MLSLLAGAAALLLREAGGQPARNLPSRPAAAPTVVSAPASRPATHPASFKVATFNILYVNRDLKAVADTIRAADADVVCLQETNDPSERYLRAQLGKVYPYATFRNGEAACGFGVLSKVPLRNVKHLPAKFGWFGTHVCEANLAGRAVQIVDVHLQPTVPPENANLAQAVALWARGEATRAREIEYILQNTSAKLPRLIAGDFNAMPEWSATTVLKQKGFVDGLASACKDHAKMTTWKGGRKDTELSLRVDYVFHPPALRTTEARILPCGASDHSLVVCTLSWAAPATAPASRPASPPTPPKGR